MKKGMIVGLVITGLVVVVMLSMGLTGTVSAEEMLPVPITADEAFDAVQLQLDPITGEPADIVLVDVRSRAEFFWVGAACQVNEIILDNRVFYPDYGKVKLLWHGLILKFNVNGRPIFMPVKKVQEIVLSPMAVNIPYKFWNEDTATMETNTDFGIEIEDLAVDFDTIIFFCRSGGRSEDCLDAFDPALFDNIYEIDQPDGKSGRGGFEGASYGDAYNGYRGFPDRFTQTQEHSSVSWEDTGLPIKTSVDPFF
jgi:rhodanese-related sulfurtransferase